jgi:methyl-accepting chemotaxis protein
MKIGTRLVVIISIFNVVGIGFLSALIFFLSQNQIHRMVDENAVSMAVQGSEKIKSWLGKYMDASRTLAQVMEGYKSIPPAQRRGYFDLMMQQVVRKNRELVGVWTDWGPNALDGMDAQYANTPGTDASGRYVPVWTNAIGGPWAEPLTDYDNSDFYTLPMRTGSEVVLDPYVYSASWGEVLITSLCIPIKEDGKTVGVAGVGIELSKIQAIANTIRPFDDGFALVFSSGGIVAAHTDPARIGKDMRQSEQDTFGSFLDTAVSAVSQGREMSFSAFSPQLQTMVNYYSVPFLIENSLTPWTLTVGIPQDTIMAPIYRMVLTCVIIGAAVILAGCLGAFFMSRTVSKPIVYTMKMLKNISEGEGDLTHSLTVKSKDEMGELAHYFNLTLEKIRNLVVVIKRKAESLFDIGADLASNMTETAAAINEITANIQSIKGRVLHQSSGVTETNATMEQVRVNIEKLSGHVKRQGEYVSRSSAAIEEMAANIKSVAATLEQNTRSVRELMEASEVGRSSLGEVSSDIQEVARESAGLLEINAVMENLASQTNLLSMNAAIEAAHAGEAGKGFAVVADEIRKLAESSAEQSKTISGVLKKIKESIDKIIKGTDNVLQKFEAIEGGVRTVSNQAQNIRSAMDEQEDGSRQMLEVIKALNEITEEVKGGAVEMLDGSEGVIQESKDLEMVTQEIANGMNEMAAGTEQINVAVTRVNDISGQNKGNIEVLVQEVSKFKVE